MHPVRRRWLLGLAATGAGPLLAGAGGVGANPATTATAGSAGPAPPGPAARSALATAAGDDDRIAADRPLRFPRDHGAHPGARIEWWYATGWLDGGGGALLGFQLTFFRSRTGLAAGLAGRFAPRQLLFAHAAVTDLAAGRHRHAQRLARWSGDEAQPEAHAARADTRLALGPWTLRREAAGPTDLTAPAAPAARYRARLAAPDAGFTLDATLTATQPLLLQGQAGHSRKGPLPQQASHYYSQPQLAAAVALTLDGRLRRLAGRAWLDHEWSDELLAPGATGWDWVGINLADGGALTAFVLRRADGSVVWAGGSHRPAGGAVRPFAADSVHFGPGRRWTSPATGAAWPVEWQLATPAGRFALRALLDAQELDSRAGVGTVYWEGLAELLDTGGRRVGLGYLEMTGRAQALRLG